jgi:glycosyltransferase involved in cell wall biosynthesis
VSLKRVAIICFEGPHHIMGGVQRRLAAEVAYLSKLDIELTMIYSGNGEIFTDRNICYIPIRVPALIYPVQTMLFSMRVARLLHRLPFFDLIETHHDAGLSLLLSILFYGKKPGKVWVEVIHGVFLDEFLSIFRHGPLFSLSTLRAGALAPLSLCEMLAAHLATLVVAVSDYAANKIHQLYRVPRSRIYIFGNGIDTNFFCPAHPLTGAPPPSSGPAVRRFVFVGRLDPRKGPLVLVRAMAGLRAEYPAIDLEMIGTGLQEQEIREECERLHLSDIVHLRGRLSDREIAEAYHAAYAACMPSLQEGQGISALEAQACGTPVIASRAGGLPEAVLDGQTGILVSPGDVAGWSKALLDLCRDDELRARLAYNAPLWAASFDWDIQLRKVDQLYRALLENEAG